MAYTGIIKAYNEMHELLDQGVYKNTLDRKKFMQRWRPLIPGGYFDISIRRNRWMQSGVVADVKKKMVRPPAVYDNKNWNI